MNQNDDAKPATVVAAPQPAGEATPPRDPPAPPKPGQGAWWVERSVWTERMLTRLTFGESADRVWFRLWDKTCAPAHRARAFDKVWKKGGSAGADEQTPAHSGRQAEEEL